MPKRFNTHTGTLKSKLEEAGVIFQKSFDGRVWHAMLDGESIGRHKELGLCIKQAAESVGEV